MSSYVNLQNYHKYLILSHSFSVSYNHESRVFDYSFPHPRKPQYFVNHCWPGYTAIRAQEERRAIECSALRMPRNIPGNIQRPRRRRCRGSRVRFPTRPSFAMGAGARPQAHTELACCLRPPLHVPPLFIREHE